MLVRFGLHAHTHHIWPSASVCVCVFVLCVCLHLKISYLSCCAPRRHKTTHKTEREWEGETNTKTKQKKKQKKNQSPLTTSRLQHAPLPSPLDPLDPLVALSSALAPPAALASCLARQAKFCAPWQKPYRNFKTPPAAPGTTSGRCARNSSQVRGLSRVPPSFVRMRRL